jgi:TonB family protein
MPLARTRTVATLNRAIAFPVLAVCANAIVAQETSSILRTEEIVGAEPIERSAPDYPRRDLENGNVGWVAMSFMVSETGEVTDAMIQASSASKGLETAALAALRKWRYRPATVYGRPVESSLDTVIRFEQQVGASANPLSASRKVIASFRELQSSLAARDIPKSEALLTGLRSLKRNIYEEAWLQWYESMYLDLTKGDVEEQRTALAAAIGYDKKVRYLDPEIFVFASARLFALDVQAGDLGSALDVYERLIADEDAKPTKQYAEIQPKLEATVRQIERAVAGENVLSIRGRIGEHDYWVHRLLRRSFSLGAIQGSLDELSVRCPHRRVTFTPPRDEHTWTVPASFGDCRVFLKGTPGATFEFYELPASADEPAAAPTPP